MVFIAALIGVPAAQVAYIVLAEAALARLPDRRRQAVRPWIWMAPALILLGVFLIYPAAGTFWLSFFDARSDRFVGWQNYHFALTNAGMRVAFRNNLVWLIAFTTAAVGLGLSIAALADRVRYETVVKTILFLPMAISFVAAGVIWKFVYEFRPAGVPQIGLLNAALGRLLPGFEPVAWLVHPMANTLALIVVAVWVWVGFCLVILSAALKAIPAEILEAARVDGAGEWRAFWSIIVPMLGPTITVVATTMVVFALKAFDIVYVMTSGHFDTEVIANRMYKEMFNFRNFGRASAIAVILFSATVPVMAANIRRFRRHEALR
jgi:alpha-glucoside transport system permease protein